MGLIVPVATAGVARRSLIGERNSTHEVLEWNVTYLVNTQYCPARYCRYC
jgi:hypothetical protein